MKPVTRRLWIGGGIVAGAGVTAVTLAGRAGLLPPNCKGIYGPGESLTYAAQRLLTRNRMAREFDRSQISAKPFSNGRPPQEARFKQLEAGRFKDWRLTVDGLVDRPLELSLDELRSYPRTSQITHLACEEGWSYIAEWAGVRLSHVLQLARMKPGAKFVVYHSSEKYWTDSIDLDDALHPQTLLTYEMNGAELTPPFGGPLRMRVPRQLGYKSVKYITKITVVESLQGVWQGGEYSWYAGI